MRIGIVAGEPSGDLLGAELIHALRVHHPFAAIEGIGGPKMVAAGFHTHCPLETLSVMGLIEVLRHYPRLKQCRDNLASYFLRNPPDVFIGIDAPDFNLGLEQILKAARIPTVHYVSPSVWAWRQYRLRRIARACDLMLTLFPFEAKYYQNHQIPVKFVGHPLADKLPLHTETTVAEARQHLGIPVDGEWLALLPGSRYTEISKLGVPFLKTALWLLARRPHLRFLVPFVNNNLKMVFASQLAKIAPTLPLMSFVDHSHAIMAAADVVLMASGTATLEAMLLKRPMVVAYRLAPLTYWLAKPLVRIPYFALPNLLAQELLVPEFLQNQVTPERLGNAVLHWLDHPERVAVLQERFLHLHYTLRQNANQQATQAILALCQNQ